MATFLVIGIIFSTDIMQFFFTYKLSKYMYILVAQILSF